MSDLKEINCPGCGKRFCYRASTHLEQLRLACPGCGKNILISRKGPAAQDAASQVLAATVVATPVFQTSSQPADPLVQPALPTTEPRSNAALSGDFDQPNMQRPMMQRPVVKSLRPSPRASQGPSPRSIKIAGIAVVGVVLLGLGSFAAFRILMSGPLTSLASASTDETSTIAMNSSATEADDTATHDDFENDEASDTGRSNPSKAAKETTTRSTALTREVTTSEATTRSAAGSSGNSVQIVAAPATLSATVTTRPASADGSSSASLADVIERAEQSVVRIEVSLADGGGLGSGFVVDDQGTLITNCHVLAGAQRATAHFPDGRTCRVIGTLHIDESKDIVVARISDRAAPALPVAGSFPRKGERVTALGAPHGLSFTATSGIISALRAGTEMGSEQRGTWIQVDAALSPGNSGGPLINGAGEVVGMSTLASQGSAQNLNFGISSVDIREAISLAGTSALTDLSRGVGKVKMRESRTAEGGMEVREATISDAALAEYAKVGIDDFDELSRGLRNEGTRLSLQLKEMRKGKSFIPPELRENDVVIARVTPPGQRLANWFFLNDAVKQATIDRQIARIKVCNDLKSKITKADDSDSLFALLWNFGPRLDMRRNHSIGFVDELIVVHAFNEHEVLAVLDDTPVVLWAPSTTGLVAGEILEGPVYVSGTVTAELRSGITASVTVLQLLTESQLRQVTHGDDFRRWSDRSGSFAVEGKLLGQDDTQIVLQKKDGAIINVPRNKLSDADQAWLNDH